MKRRANKLLAGLHNIQRGPTHRQRFRHFIQMPRALFTVAGDARLVAHARRQIADHQPDGEHHGKGQDVLYVRHGERPARGNKEQIKADDVNHRCQHRRPASVKERHHHHAKEVDHHQVGRVEGNQPFAGNDRDQGAEHDGHQAAAKLNAPFITESTAVRGAAGKGRGFIIQRHDYQVQIRRAAGQFVGKGFTAKPATMLATANDDFPQVMLPGVAQNGFIFLRIGKGGGFGTQLLRQAQRTQNRAALVFGQGMKLRRFDIHRMPDAAKFGGQTRGGADKFFVTAAVPHAQQDGIPRMPDAFLALQIAPGTHLIVNAIGSTAQS